MVLHIKRFIIPLQKDFTILASISGKSVEKTWNTLGIICPSENGACELRGNVFNFIG